MKNTSLFKSIILLMLLFCFDPCCILGQKYDQYTFDNAQYNRYMHRAIRMREAGKIITFGGAGAAAAVSIYAVTTIDKTEPYSGIGAAVLILSAVTGMAVTTAIGVPLWVIGSRRIDKAVVGLKTFSLGPCKSVAFGPGITLRF